ncbi:Nucleic acid-binding OB-fold [Penicillium verrucosum]|uniref:Nucleic acid-binding OB-fold n=1 Tax=Penicillium verrucosum TaxID=60171 RepID=UPI002544D336|nr:Nucleic acid-binding OB-fold [Penicillium verrucosum]KAJ5922768.1 Nucleic acid-binding OB-fold [Penicillium verrucosum]
MGYYDEEGNYHSFTRAPENQLTLKKPQLLPRPTASKRAGHHDNGEASKTSEPHDLHDDNGTYDDLKDDKNREPPLQDRDSGVPGGNQPFVTIPCHFIRIGDILLLNQRPCQVIRISVSSQTGQCRYLGVDLFSRHLREETSFVANPSPDVIVQSMLGPVYRFYRLLEMNMLDGTVVAMTETGDVKLGIPVLPQMSLIERIEREFANGKGTIRVLVISEVGSGRELVVDFKNSRGIMPATSLASEPDEYEHRSDGIEVEVYAFSKTGEPSVLPVTEDDKEAQEHTSLESPNPFPGYLTAHNVDWMEFQGETEVTLWTVTTPTTHSSPRLFRWIHMQPPVMRFNDFKENATRIPGLSDSEKKSLNKLLERVESECDRKPSPNTTGRFMKPGHLTETFPRESFDLDILSWLCLPYFCLDALCSDSNEFSDSYPMQRLLQDLMLKPEQEKKQVMSLMNPPENGKCLHVAQLWAIEMNNSLLVTYGNLDLSKLDGIDLKDLPPSQTNQPPKIPPRRIFVSFEKRVMWSLPLEDCITWPSFLSHFTEFDTTQLVFTYGGEHVEPSQYAELLNGEHDIKLALNITEGSDIFSEVNGGFAVFEWLTDNGTALHDDGDHGKAIRVQERLTAIDEFLKEQNVDSRAYTDAPLLNSEAVRELVKESELATSTAQAAESLYGFFVPPNATGPVLGKYWGAVHSLIRNLQSDPTEDISPVKDFCDQLIDLARQMNPIKLRFSRPGLIKPPTDKSSHPLEIAWIHLLMSLISVKRMPHRSRQHINTCSGLLILGITRVKDTFSGPPPQKPKVILPFDIATLIGFRLLGECERKHSPGRETKGISKKKSPAMDIKMICKSYSDYLDRLKKRVQVDKLDVSHKEEIEFLQTQIKHIQDRLADKKVVWDALTIPTANTKMEVKRESRQGTHLGDGSAHSISKPGTVDAFNETNDEPESYSNSQHMSQNSLTSLRSIYSENCRNLINETAEEFRQLMVQARTLKDMNDKKIQNDKSRQDFAIYAFTIVTIIFLPLNTVSSIFGMNTTDIRNIESGQWIYWAVAIPLTVIVMALTLFWAGELEIFYNLVKSFPRRRNVS